MVDGLGYGAFTAPLPTLYGRQSMDVAPPVYGVPGLPLLEGLGDVTPDTPVMPVVTTENGGSAAYFAAQATSKWSTAKLVSETALRFWPLTLGVAAGTWWLTRNATGSRRVIGVAVPVALLGLLAYGMYEGKGSGA